MANFFMIAALERAAAELAKQGTPTLLTLAVAQIQAMDTAAAHLMDELTDLPALLPSARASPAPQDSAELLAPAWKAVWLNETSCRAILTLHAVSLRDTAALLLPESATLEMFAPPQPDDTRRPHASGLAYDLNLLRGEPRRGLVWRVPGTPPVVPAGAPAPAGRSWEGATRQGDRGAGGRRAPAGVEAPGGAVHSVHAFKAHNRWASGPRAAACSHTHTQRKRVSP